jgi:hypothetical protein
MLDDGCTAVDPIPAVDVTDAVDILDGGRVDMSADDPLDSPLLDVAGNGVFEVEDEAYGVLDLVFGVTR